MTLAVCWLDHCEDAMMLAIFCSDHRENAMILASVCLDHYENALILASSDQREHAESLQFSAHIIANTECF